MLSGNFDNTTEPSPCVCYIATLAEDAFTAGAGIVDTVPVVAAWLAAFGLS